LSKEFDWNELPEKTRIKLCDFNNDGTVNEIDADMFQKAFGYREGDPGYQGKYDLNKDGIIDIYDAVLFGKEYGKSWK